MSLSPEEAAEALARMRHLLSLPPSPAGEDNPLDLEPEVWDTKSKSDIERDGSRKGPAQFPLAKREFLNTSFAGYLPEGPFNESFLFRGVGVPLSEGARDLRYSPSGATYSPAALAQHRLQPAVPERVSDVTLCRFLRARNYDADEAAKMFGEAMASRTANRADNILLRHDPDELVWQTQSPHLHGYKDKLGRPLYIERSGTVRVGEMIKQKMVTLEDFKRRHLRHMEIMEFRLDSESQRRGELVQQITVIMDLKNLSFKPDSAAMAAFKDTIKMDQNCYPERLGDLFIINAPWIFSTLWPVIKLWMDKKTRAKFHVLGGSYQEKLLRYIDAEQLPEEYGGNAKIPVPMKISWEEALERKKEFDPPEPTNRGSKVTDL